MCKLEVLCVTMHQKDFSKIKEMNLHSNVVFANQADFTSYESLKYEDYLARMITTDTRGVGVNRNIALLYADADICLLADDDMVYEDDYVEKVVYEFKTHPDADMIIFNIGTSTPELGIFPSQIKKFAKMHWYSRNPYGGPRIAVKLETLKKMNISFSTLFGGGSTFLRGEDTLFIKSFINNGKNVYLSPKSIGKVSYNKSTSISDDNRQILYDLGAFLESSNSFFKWIYVFYYICRLKNRLSLSEALFWIRSGMKGFKKNLSFSEIISKKKQYN